MTDQLADQMINIQLNPIEDVYFICLFSILCFGQKRSNIYQLGSGSCHDYDHPSGLNSLKCDGNSNLNLLGDSRFHTLAIDGRTEPFNGSNLCSVQGKHIILQNLDLTDSWFGECLNYCSQEHQSLTLFSCSNILDWNLNCFTFNHLHIERSDLSSMSKITRLLLPDNLKSLTLISCLISDIPTHLFEGLTSLRMLTISKNSLKTIQRYSFPKSGLDSLWFLDLSFNKIEYIDEFIDSYFPNLVELNLQSNHLQKLPEQPFFKNWINIDIVNLDANALICERVCWLTKFKPHPIFFDSADCYLSDFSKIDLGGLNAQNTECLTV